MRGHALHEAATWTFATHHELIQDDPVEGLLASLSGGREAPAAKPLWRHWKVFVLTRTLDSMNSTRRSDPRLRKRSILAQEPP